MFKFKKIELNFLEFIKLKMLAHNDVYFIFPACF